ncbi:hypothetical protein KO516_09030 [Citreicella sp. C3M06]|uniref:hypothetical protein n=1 Tax=Citreicella sp. C3M06 TaxID=2841564 RepID=UPI001C09E0AD|nr:hypothetical protein [Citreicella sp. C3M06]
MTRLLAPLTLLLSASFALSPMMSGGFAGFRSTQFPVVQAHAAVQPVGWAFAIWGPVFLGLLLSAGWGLLRHRRDPHWQAMRAPLIASLGIGTVWIWAANFQPLLASVLILFMAASAIEALLRAPRSRVALWPVGLYAGWVTSVACVAVGVVLGGYGVLGSQGAALLLLSALGGLAAVVLWQRPGGLAFAGGVAWAYAGVIVANLDPLNPAVLMVCTAALLLLAAVPVLRRVQP